MTRRIFSRESKQEAVDLVTKRDVGAAAADGPAAFPGAGKLTPEREELRTLRREVSKLKAERDILKKAAAYFAI